MNSENQLQIKTEVSPSQKEQPSEVEQ